MSWLLKAARFSSALVPPRHYQPISINRCFSSLAKKRKLSQKEMGQLQVTAQEYFDKAFHFEKTGQLSEAENALSSCLAHRLEAFGSDNHDHVVSALNSLGKLHIMCQQPQIAVPLLKRAVAAAAIVHGEMVRLRLLFGPRLDSVPCRTPKISCLLSSCWRLRCNSKSFKF